MTDQITVAVIGLGWMGAVHSRAYNRLTHHFDDCPRPVLVAVAVLPAVLADLRSDPGAGSEPGPTVSSPTDPIAAAPERADA